MGLDEDVRAELSALAASHRLRTPRIVDGARGAMVTLDGATVLNLSSNDYLGLAADPRVARAAIVALEEHGTGAGASRLITGTHRLHEALEHAVADWMHTAGARLFSSGYAANLGVLTTLLRPGDVVFSDELNHASIIDGCRLSRAHIVVYPHGDVAGLAALLGRHAGQRQVVVTESLFSMDGDIVDVEAIARVSRAAGAALIVDEAHAVGCHGPEGRGVCAEHGVAPDVLVGTFGKALGTYGAFAACSTDIAALLWNRARSFVFSTALPPSVAAATLAALAIVRGGEGDERRRRLAGHARRLRARVPRAGGAPTSAIAPILVGDDREVMLRTAALLAAGVFVQGIRPPTVPPGTARLRVSLSSGLADDQVELAADLLDDAVQQ